MEITVTGVPEVLAKLQKLENLERHAEPAIKAAAAHVEQKAKHYPPAPAGSKYIRTGRLRAGWYSDARGLTGWARNAGVPYNVYVQGNRQRGFHRATGWKTDADLAQSEAGAVARIISSALKRAIR